jgi:hypothetical protein
VCHTSAHTLTLGCRYRRWGEVGRGCTRARAAGLILTHKSTKTSIHTQDPKHCAAHFTAQDVACSDVAVLCCTALLHVCHTSAHTLTLGCRCRRCGERVRARAPPRAYHLTHKSTKTSINTQLCCTLSYCTLWLNFAVVCCTSCTCVSHISLTYSPLVAGAGGG